MVTLGGYSEYLPYLHPMVYAENYEPPSGKSEETNYSVYLRKIYLRKGGGESTISLLNDVLGAQELKEVLFDYKLINEDFGNRVSLDSDSPFTLLSTAIEDPFKRMWKELTGVEYTYAEMKLSPTELEQLPTFYFQLRVRTSCELDHLSDIED